MLNVLFTLDYEIHGNGDGCPLALMVEPTRRMMDLFDAYGAKLTIMADVAEILKFKEYQEQFGCDDYAYNAIAAQLREAMQRGHDVQLHLHASYFNARHEQGRWLQDWSEYNFAALPFERLDAIVGIGKRYLEDVLRPVKPDYQCIAFRAANWAVSPSRNVVRALLSNGLKIDTSVFKYGRRTGLVTFDYTAACSNIRPWRASEDDICRRDDQSRLLEVPIYSEYRWLWSFLTCQRLVRMRQSRRHRIGLGSGNGAGRGAGLRGRLNRMLGAATRRHAWKADFNQCSGGQLIRALERGAAAQDASEVAIPFVLIGHSKLFTRYNAKSLRPFLKHVADTPGRFRFATFGEADWQPEVTTAFE